MILREGDKGDLVEKLQEALAYLGYHPGPLDGHFGSATEDAVEAFQKKSKIYMDGAVGPSTADMLNRALGSPKIELHLNLSPPETRPRPTISFMKRFMRLAELSLLLVAAEVWAVKQVPLEARNLCIMLAEHLIWRCPLACKILLQTPT